ncbi:MAG: hypothetical protein WD489_00190 [Rhodovibrionaceae bacterium]
MHRRWFWLAILGNLLWIAASLALAVSGWVSPTALGLAFLLVQAAAVALLTVLEFAALRGGRAAAAI